RHRVASRANSSSCSGVLWRSRRGLLTAEIMPSAIERTMYTTPNPPWCRNMISTGGREICSCTISPMRWPYASSASAVGEMRRMYGSSATTYAVSVTGRDLFDGRVGGCRDCAVGGRHAEPPRLLDGVRARHAVLQTLHS